VGAATVTRSRPLRPAPSASRDSAFFWEGVQRGVLLGQQCAGCGRLRHPPRPMCPHCRSLEWRALELSGRGHLHACIEPVHPALPMFEPGTLVALVDLEEGIRLLSNLRESSLEEARVGMEVEVCFEATDGGQQIHQFRPLQRAPRG